MTDPVTELGDRDVVDVLTEDHHAVLALIQLIGDSQDADQRRDTLDTVIAELVRHSVAEEMFVYPAIRRHVPDGTAAVEHDVEEHKALELTMKALEATPVSDLQFNELVDTLEAQLRQHASDEEDHQFPGLREHLSRAELTHLGERVLLAKQIAPTRPHPASPNRALFHKTLGAGVGFVDKLRDAVSGRIANT